MPSHKSFKDLQDLWYKRIKQKGFIDIENTKLPSCPLKKWDSFTIPSERFQIIKNSKSLYQQEIENFHNHPEFKEICKSIVKHGNSKFKAIEIEIIWSMHVEGYTQRRIAKEFKKAKSRIDDVIKGLREWMSLI